MRVLVWAILFLAAQLAVVPEAAARYASIVIDADSGRVLYEVNADTRNYPASLTKMMTLYMAFEALEKGKLRLNENLKVSRRAAGMAPSKLGLKRGQTIKVKEIILSLVTKSANDAAVVMAEALAGTEVKFAKRMTAKARELGMSRTNFRNASGLPNRRQLSTARDMAILAQALINRFPKYYNYFSTTSFSYNGRRHRNHNSLLKNYDGADGIKTGYIRASGFNLVASAMRDGRRIIGVVFGGKSSRSRDKHMVKLLDRGFKRVARGVRQVSSPPSRNPFHSVALAEAVIEGESLRAPLGQAVSEAQMAALSAKVAAQQAQRQRDAEAATASAVTPDSDVSQTLAGMAAKAPPLDQAGEAILAGGKAPLRVPQSEDVDLAPLIEITRGTQTIATEPGIDVVELPPLETGGPATPRAISLTELETDAPTGSKQRAWGVQVGAYRNFAPAQLAASQAARRIPKVLKSSKPVVSQVIGQDGQLYRARLAGLTETLAREACRQLKTLNQGCLVIPPERMASEPSDAG